MKPFVVDANVMNTFQQERYQDLAGEAVTAIAAMTEVSHIVLDAEGRCENEWIACAGGTYPFALKDWLADMYVSQKIRLADFCRETMHRELTGLGIPKKDHKWVRLAIGAKSAALVTDDIDLFDPAKKGQSAAVTARIKQSGKGPVARYLRRTYGINVICCPHVTEYIEQIATQA